MGESLTGFALQVAYIFNHMTDIQIVDISLVAFIFFVVFQALHQTRTLQLLRGVIIIAILGGTLLVLLPLDTLKWLVRILLVAGVIALPLLFQDELRRALISLGQIGRRRIYDVDFEHFRSMILTVMQHLASRSEGALVVLEGQTPLDDIIATGIPLKAEETSAELLETIFHPRTPLHDGAVILRGERLMAASCILPVQTEGTGDKHLGTRHRAALALSSKFPDALVIVVSEETGQISVAWAGRLHSNLTGEQLLKWLDRFRDQLVGNSHSRWSWLRGGGLASTMINLTVAAALALIAWLSVAYQTNPPGQVVIGGVPLAVIQPKPGLVLMDQLPQTVKVQVQTTKDRASSLDASSLRAEISLENLTPGIHHVPVQVTAADQLTQVMTVSPDYLDLNLEQELGKVITPTITIEDPDTLPPGYVIGDVHLSPGAISVKGPKSLVDSVTEAGMKLSLNGRRSDFQETLPVSLLDITGKPVEAVQMAPREVLVTVSIRRTFFTREVAIQAVLEKNGLDKDYEVTSVEITPTSVTLAGNQLGLEKAGDFLATAPISLTNVRSEFSVQAPLIVPSGLAVMDQQNKNVINVTVKVTVSPVKDYLVVEQNINVLNLPISSTATLAPERTSLLLIGPRPLLKQISTHPEMLSVYIDLAGYTAGSYTVHLKAEVPPDIQIQLFPADIQVALSIIPGS